MQLGKVLNNLIIISKCHTDRSVYSVPTTESTHGEFS